MNGTFRWNYFFDAIYLVNLPDRMDRREAATHELNQYFIPFLLWPAIRHEDGKTGIRLTMQSLLEHALTAGYKRILVFEDDIKFIKDPNLYMLECQKQLSSIRDWDLFYLGVNTHKPFGNLITPNLLRVQNGYALHAVAYSDSGMQKCLKSFNEMPTAPIDVCIDELVQIQGQCYCSYPMLATQKNNYSDIDKKEVSYDYIESRFYIHTKHLLNGTI
jgi:hypothetical protein